MQRTHDAKTAKGRGAGEVREIQWKIRRLAGGRTYRCTGRVSCRWRIWRGQPGGAPELVQNRGVGTHHHRSKKVADCEVPTPSRTMAIDSRAARTHCCCE
jgi:hypothetical protein